MLAYDPFGERRNSDWIGAISPAEFAALLAEMNVRTSRGFTGHEHLDRTGLIHMNGRIYDPQLGRFLSPDPFIPHPTLAQSWNRYSYVRNNPLSYTDPSGFMEEIVITGHRTSAPGPSFWTMSYMSGTNGYGTAIPTGMTAEEYWEAWFESDISDYLAQYKTEMSERFNQTIGKVKERLAGEEIIGDALETLIETQWANTPEGKKIIKLLDGMYKEGKIVLKDLAYISSWMPGRIDISSSLDPSKIPGRLAHEGMHAYYHSNGLAAHKLSEEVQAFHAGYLVDVELGIPGAFEPSIDKLRETYVNDWPYLIDDETQ